MLAADRPDPAGQHDRLVIAVQRLAARGIRQRHLQRAEVASQRRPPELVIERGRADRALQHDLARALDPAGAAKIAFPGLLEARDSQVGHGESGQPSLGLGPLPGSPLVADLPAGARRGAGERRDRGRVVMSLHLHQDRQVQRFTTVFTGDRIRHQPRTLVPRDHRGVVAVGGQHPLGMARMGLADHTEQRAFIALAVQHPGGIEDLVPAVFRVRLREHHQLGIGRRAAKCGVAFRQVVDLIRRQRQTQVTIGAFQRRPGVLAQFHARQRARSLAMKELRGDCGVLDHGLGHPVVQQVGKRLQIRVDRRFASDLPVDATLDALDRVLQPGVMGNLGGLGRPRADRAETWDHDQFALDREPGRHPVLALAQQARQHGLFVRRQPAACLHEIDKTGGERARARYACPQPCLQGPQPKRRDRRASFHNPHCASSNRTSQKPRIVPDPPPARDLPTRFHHGAHRGHGEGLSAVHRKIGSPMEWLE